MKDKLESELITLDKKRLNIRKKYKSKLINSKKQSNKKDFIFFPKSIIRENNYQLRYGLSWLQNGFIIKKGDNVIAVDPGVNFMFRLTESGFDVSSITHIFISHSHLDHSADANVLMDFLIRGKKAVKIIAPKSVFDEKVISDFHSRITVKFPVNHSAIIIDKNSEVELFNGYKMTFMPLNHSVECYGFKISDTDKIYTYLSDTAFSKEVMTKDKKIINVNDIKDYAEDVTSYSYNNDIKEFVRESEILICNVDSLLYTKNSKTHLSTIDLIELAKDNYINTIILAHINPIGELKYEEWSYKLAKYVFAKTKIQTIAIKRNGNKIYI